MNNLKKRKITLVLTCESETFLSNNWFKQDLMQEISCCAEFYRLESFKVEEVEKSASGTGSETAGISQASEDT